MRQFITNYWLTLLLSLVTIGVLIWTRAGVLELLDSVDEIYVQNQTALPTQLPQLSPTDIPIPPLPQGIFSLDNESGKNILLSDQGVPIYELNSSRQWIPIIPDQISKNLPENSEFIVREGIWIITGKGGVSIYRWNPSLQRWMEAKIASSSSSETEQPFDQYMVVSDQFDLSDLISKTDEELLAMAPQLIPEVFGTDTNILSPSAVLRIGENEDIPYLLYTDRTGQVRMGWNVERSVVEYVEESIYQDPETRFLVHALVITDSVTAREEKKRYSLHELSSGDLAKAIFEYTLPINYYFWNYRDEFIEMAGESYSNTGVLTLRKLGFYKMDDFIEEVRKVFAEDLMNISDEERAIIRIGNSSNIQVDNEAYILFRIKLGASYGAQGGGSSNNITIIPQAWFRSDISQSVGGLLIKTLREITIGGVQSGERRSTTEEMVIDLCGDEVIGDYLNRIGREIRYKELIPVTDRLTENLPLCLLEEHQVP